MGEGEGGGGGGEGDGDGEGGWGGGWVQYCIVLYCIMSKQHLGGTTILMSFLKFNRRQTFRNRLYNISYCYMDGIDEMFSSASPRWHVHKFISDCLVDGDCGW